MPRPTAYTRTRQMVMQASMIGVLVIALAGAALLGRTRQQRWAVELNPVPHLTQRLSMKLPKGWHVGQTPQDAVRLIVTATQLDGGDAVRVLRVEELPTEVETGDALLGTYLSRTTGVTTDLRPFEFLGRPGVLVGFTALSGGDDSGPTVAIVAKPQWYAATVILAPEARRTNRGIIVALVEGPGGPSDERVVREVAGSLALRPGG